MKHLYLLFALTIIIASCKNDSGKANTGADEVQAEEKTSSGITLTQVWESPSTLITAESVLWDEANGLYFVSCIGAVPPTAEDGDGYIAQIDQQGNVLNPSWAKGLDAPKGMAIQGEELYVTDINEFVVIDYASGNIKERIPVEGAEFLNDIAIGPDGQVLFSDSNTNKIHEYADGTVTTYMEDTLLGGPNGLFIDDSFIYVSSFGSGDVHTIDRKTKALQNHGKGTVPGGDGVEPWDGGMVFSNWNGEVYYLDAEWNTTKVLDTKEAKMNAADIEINQGSKQLLVPTFFGNSVVCYEITSKS
jgi:sugar lactone lactonase YvrE